MHKNDDKNNYTTSHSRNGISYPKVNFNNAGGGIKKRKMLNSVTNNIKHEDINYRQNNCGEIYSTQSVTETTSASSYSKMGGRLQFFKDGKFILELARSKEGDKFGWVSVPKKTVKPAVNSTLYSKNESCTSLSFSDDNSSVQSSPWQRDHVWKKAIPRKNISQEMCLSYVRGKKYSFSSAGYKIARSKRRRPYEETKIEIPLERLYENGTSVIAAGAAAAATTTTTVASAPVQSTENDDNNSLVSNNNPNQANKIKQKLPKSKNRDKLTIVIQKLIDRLPTGLEYLSKSTSAGGISNISANALRLVDFQYQPNISPRKRILRELEKVSLDDNMKRSRAKNNIASISDKSKHNSSNSHLSSTNNIHSTVQNGGGASSSFNSNNNSSTSSSSKGNTKTNETDKGSTVQSSTKLYSSYSIHSLLGNLSKKNYTTSSTSKISQNNMYQGIRRTGENSAFTTTSKRSPSYSRDELIADSNRSPIGEIHDKKQHSPDSKIYSKLLDSRNSSSPSYSDLHMPLDFTNQENIHNSSQKSLQYSNKTKSLSCIPVPSYCNVGTSHSSSSSSATECNYKVKTESDVSRSPNSSKRIDNIQLPSQFTFLPTTSLNNDIPPRKSSISPNRKNTRPTNIDSSNLIVHPHLFPSAAAFNSATQLDKVSDIDMCSDSNIVMKDREPPPDYSEQRLYNSTIDMKSPSIANFLGTTNSMGLPYMYPDSSSISVCHGASASYIPQSTYFHPYASAVAALRNPLWMRYQPGMVLAAPVARLPSAVFPYNRINSTVNSMRKPRENTDPGSHINHKAYSDEPMSLVCQSNDCNSDVPLNLSKH